MSTLGLESVSVSSVAHAVDLAVVTGVRIATCCLDAVGFDTGFIGVNAWKKGEGNGLGTFINVYRYKNDCAFKKAFFRIMRNDTYW